MPEEKPSGWLGFSKLVKYAIGEAECLLCSAAIKVRDLVRFNWHSVYATCCLMSALT